jgi:formylglycine-generating enzyme required for sulfatase activity
MRGQVTARPRVAGADPVGERRDPPAAPKPPDIAGWLAWRQARFSRWQAVRGCPKSADASESPVQTAYSATGDCGVSNATRAIGEVWDIAEAPEMMVLPAGTYLMGSPAYEPDRRSNEGPQHRVSIDRPFAVSKYLVTFDEWDACVAQGGCRGYSPGDARWGRGDRPVINVSWGDAVAYVAWLSARTGQHYRLLSESEWEYAARAGTDAPYYFGDTITTDQVNYDGVDYPVNGVRGSYRGTTTPVGSFPPNAFGLYDMSGNVWEWTTDCWNEDYRAGRAPADGAPWLSGDCNRRVVRAGAFNNSPSFARSAFRFWEVADLRSALMGFRIAREM